MKTLLTFLLVLFSLFVKGDYWTRKADFPGVARGNAIGFSIGNKGYFGLGIVGVGLSVTYFKDFWEYDPLLNIWTQKADYGGTATRSAVSFVIGNNVYVGTGGDISSVKNDFWVYNPTINSWTQKADFGGASRYGATGFSIGNKGYIGTGFNVFCRNDFWEYNSLTDSWTQKANFGGGNRYFAFGISVGNKGYIGGGADASSLFNDFWEYDTASNNWMQRANIGGGAAWGVCAFCIGSKIFIGADSSNNFWEYDTNSNIWSKKASFPGVRRTLASGFSINNKGYLGIGDTSIGGTFSYADNDFWEYTFDSTTAINEPPSSTFQFQLSPNPAHQVLVVSWQALGEKKVEIRIIDINGKNVGATFTVAPYTAPDDMGNRKGCPYSPCELIDVSGLAAGIYFLVADDGVNEAVRKFAKE